MHVGDLGLSTATDAAILERARTDGRACITLDADFHAILALSGARGPSTIRVRVEGLDADALASLLRTIWPQIEADVQRGAVVSVDVSSMRVRALPIE